MATLYSYNKQQFNADASFNGITSFNSGINILSELTLKRDASDTSNNIKVGTNSNGHFLYGIGSNPLRFFTNTVDRMRVDQSGNIGIGESSPDSILTNTKLQVQSTLAGAPSFNSWDNTWGLSLTNDTSTNTVGGGNNTRPALSMGLRSGHNPTAYISSLTPVKNWNNLMIDASHICLNGLNTTGNVGVGTATPGAKLSVEYNGIQANQNVLSLHGTNGADSNYNLIEAGHGTSSTFVVKGDGNVGIGTSSPGVKLEIDSGVVNSGTPGLTLKSSGTGWASGIKYENTTTNNVWASFTNGTGNFYPIWDVKNNRAALEVVKDTKNCYFYGEVNVNDGGDRNAKISDGIYYTYYSGYYGKIYQYENVMTYVSYGDVGRYAKHEFWSGDFVTNNSVRKNVSIGSVYPLEVHNYYNLTGFGGVGYMNDYITRSANSFNDNIGMNVNDGAVRALGFYAYSDKRIKKNIVDIDDGNALSILRQIKPKTYDYVDKVQRGNNSVIGFIAQEIKEVLPKAVTIVKDYVPTFYTNCQITVTDASNILLVTSPIDLSWNPLHDPSGNDFVDAEGNASSDASGNKAFNVKLYDQSNNNFECKTTSILDKRSFLMDVSGSKMVDASGNLLLTNNGAYFLHGQEVDDFHNIDKGAIFTVVTAAVQDIDRMQQADSEKINVLEGQITSLCPQVDSLTSEVASLTSEVASLTSEVASLTSEVASLTSQLSTLQSQMAAVLSKLNLQV